MNFVMMNLAEPADFQGLCVIWVMRLRRLLASLHFAWPSRHLPSFDINVQVSPRVLFQSLLSGKMRCAPMIASPLFDILTVATQAVLLAGSRRLSTFTHAIGHGVSVEECSLWNNTICNAAPLQGNNPVKGRGFFGMVSAKRGN